MSTVSVGRRFPFVLEVNVTDRVPLAIVQDEFGYVFLDKDGVVMDSTQSIKKSMYRSLQERDWETFSLAIR